MTESDWQTCTDPGRLLAAVGRKASERKLRLVAAACCRRIGRLLPDRRCREALAAAERFADGLADRQALAAARADVKGATGAGRPRRTTGHAAAYNVWTTTRDDIRAVVLGVLEGTAWTASYRRGSSGERALANQQAAVAGLLRDVFGSPRRHPRPRRQWLTATVVDLARAIYEDRAFDRLPILADALMDAGCADEAILGHCRTEGPHVRGCWVVDLVLGKA